MLTVEELQGPGQHHYTTPQPDTLAFTTATHADHYDDVDDEEDGPGRRRIRGSLFIDDEAEDDGTVASRVGRRRSDNMAGS